MEDCPRCQDFHTYNCNIGIPKHYSWEGDEKRKDCTGIRKEDDKETPLLDFLREIETIEDKSFWKSRVSSKRNKEGQTLRNNLDFNRSRSRDRFKTMLVSTMKMNLLTLVLVVFIPPRHLFAIY